MEERSPHPKFGAFLGAYKTSNPPYIWVGGVVAAIFALVMFSFNKVPLWAVGVLAVPLSFIPIHMFQKGRRLREQDYVFYESGFVQRGKNEPVEVAYANLKLVAGLTSVTLVSPVPVRIASSSLLLIDDQKRNYRMSVSKSGFSKGAAAVFDRARGLLVAKVKENIVAAIAAGQTVPWGIGLSIRNGLVTADGNEIPWPALRFSFMNGRCTIFGPTGKLGVANVGGGNCVVVFELARAGGSEFEFPRSTFEMNRKPTAPVGFPVSPPRES